MSESAEFLRNLALILCVAAVTTVAFQRLRLPVVFGYLLAGLVVGPHVSIPVAADPAVVRTISELGVILVMFALGLGFSIRKIVQVASTGGVVAIVETSAMLVAGYALAQLLGWTPIERLFAGATVAISSTTIVVKAFEEQGVKAGASERAFGILVGEDLIAIFLMAMLTAAGSGAAFTAAGIATTGARLALFLATLVGIGLLVVPRLVRFIVRLGRPETTLVACVGISFGAALLALEFGYSVALGAFIAGALVAESGTAAPIQRLVQPVRDLFAAVFFVAVGMLIDPALVAIHWRGVTAFTVAVVVGKVSAVSCASFLAGAGVRASIRTGMSLAQIGEFSFIIVGIGLATGATRDFLYPVAVAVSAITTLLTPWLIRASDPVARFVDRKLPRPLQTFAALYGSWIERLRGGGHHGARRRLRRGVRLLLTDAAVLAAVVAGTSLELDRIAERLTRLVSVTVPAARLAVLLGAAAVVAPLLFGIVRNARLLAGLLAARALPPRRRGPDLAEAPRRVFVVALQLLVLFAVGLPLLVLLQPFLPPLRGAAAFLVIIALMLLAFWRSAANLQGHARAGAEVIVGMLERQMASGADASPPGDSRVEGLRRLLPGLGEPVPLRVEPSSPAANRSLAQLDLRGRTGATVLAIARPGADVLLPVGREVLRAGDVVALAGTAEAVAAAAVLLGTAPPGALPT